MPKTTRKYLHLETPGVAGLLHGLDDFSFPGHAPITFFRASELSSLAQEGKEKGLKGFCLMQWAFLSHPACLSGLHVL